MTPMQLSKEGLKTVKSLIESNRKQYIEINKFYLQDLTKENYKWRIHNEYKKIVNSVF